MDPKAYQPYSFDMLLRSSMIVSVLSFSLLATPALSQDTQAQRVTNDDAWGETSKINSACMIGTSQSPINISYTTYADLPALKFVYQPKLVRFDFKKYGLVTNIPSGNMLHIGNDKYQLKTITFHSPSEHTVSDNPHMMEAQLMHEDENGKMLIISVFVDLDEEADGKALEVFSENIAMPENSPKDVFWDIPSLLPDEFGYYSYNGSITTAPCTEGIQWRILKTPITITTRQFQKIAAVLGRNARVTQSVYMRTVYETRP